MKKFFTLFTLVFLSMGAYAQYCVPSYTTGPTVGDSVVSFQLEAINASFPGAASGYNDYTGLAITDLNAGGTYTATMLGNPDFAITVAIWIDYNQDTVFDAVEKLGEVSVPTAQSASITFTVPPGAVTDTTRLRMVGVFGGSGLTPCGSYTFGETEDYHVEILPPPANDVGVTWIEPKSATCGLSATEAITVELTNFGLNAQTTFPMKYSINGNTPVSETYTGSLAALGGVDTFTFATTADFSASNTTFSVQVWSELAGDGGLGNDTLTYTFTTPTIYTVPYLEDFETFVAGSPGTLANGWTSAGGTTAHGWFVENTGATNSSGTGPINAAVPGSQIYMYTETSSGAAGNVYDLNAPCISLAGTTSPRLSFYYHMFGPLMGTLNVIVKNGSSTGTDTTIFTISGQQQATETDPWTEVIVDLTPWAGGGVELNFQAIHGGIFTSDLSIDQVQVYQPAGTDATPLATITPSGQSCFTANETVTVQVRNLGASPIDFSLNPMTVGLDITGASTQTFTSPVINSGVLGVLDTLDVVVTTAADLTAAGNHVFTAYTNLTGDGTVSNDTTTGGVSSLPVFNIPFFEDFETFLAGSPGTLANGWTSDGNTSNFNGWTVETDGIQNSTNTGPLDDHTPGGQVYMYTEFGAAGAVYNLYTPCLSLTGFSSPKLSFWYHMFGADMGTLEAVVKTPSAETVIWSATGQQQGAEGDEWLEATADLTPWIGQSVQIVFRSTQGIGFTSDMAIDDVNIFQPPPIDAKALAITSPESGCGLGAAENITVQFQNFGSAALNNVVASFSINGGAFTTPETVPGTFAPGDTGTYTFTATGDFSAGGVFEVTAVVTQLSPADTVNTNDTVTLVIQNFPAYTAGYPYYQDFESGQGGWFEQVPQGGNPLWGFGTPAKATIKGAASGVNAWATALDSTFINSSNQPAFYGANEDAWVISPCFDFTPLDTPVVRMSVWWNSEFSWDGAVLQSSTDGAVTWQNVGSFGDPDNWYNDNTINGAPGGSQEGWTGRNSTGNGSGGWVVASHRLDSLGGEPSVLLRVSFGSDGSVHDDGFAFDNVSITEFSAINGQMTGLLNPVTGCGLPDTSTVEISYTNSGTVPVTNYTLSYTIVGSGVVVTETPGDTIQPGQLMSYAFNGKADLSTPGLYDIQFWINAVGDTDPVNDTTVASVEHKNAITTFPYFQNFDGPAWVQTPQTFPIGIPVVTLPGGWENIQGEANQDWAIWSGASGFNTGPTSDHTTGNDQYLFVDDSSPGNFDSVIVVTPCFDLTALNNPKFSFWYHSNNSNTPNDENELHVDLIFNGSLVFDVIPPIAHKDNNWNLVEIDLTQYIGNVAVRFRVNNNNNFGNHDIAIDDIGLVDVLPQDAGITNIAEPMSGCGLPAVDTLVLALANLGTDTLFGPINVNYTINAGPIATVVYPDTVLPGFLVPVEIPGINFSVPGDYDVVAWTSGVTGDTNFFNDTTSATIKSIPEVNTYPYIQDFENGDGGWTEEFPVGSKSLWGFGTPAKQVIQGAASGVNAWATALDSTFTNNDNQPAWYGDNEDSWVISPCFDFSALAAPTIQMSVWWESEFSWDGAVLQSTVDGGTTWENIGAFGDPDNWYTDNTINGNPGGQQEGWTGRDGSGSGGWVIAKNRMDSLAGEPSVRLRVAFGSDGSVVDDGFAFDDIFIFDTPGDDVGAVGFTDPAGFGCSDDSVVVAVNLVNFGIDTASGIPVVVDITGAGTATLNATYPGPLAPGDTANFVVGYMNTNAGGVFNLTGYTVYLGDTLVFNDSTFTSTEVTVRPPEPTAVNDSIILCTPDSAVLAVVNDTNYSYIWYDSAFGGNVLASDTFQFQTGLLSSDTSFWVEAVPGGGGPPIKVTEAELLGPDYLEIQNTGNTPVNVSGWTVAIGEDGVTSINTVATTTWTLSGTMNPGDILWRDDNAGSGTNYWGSNILWNGGQEGWVVILDQQNNVIDALFFNWSDADIQNFSPTINGATINLNGQWTGPGVVSTGFQNIRRVGNTDTNTDADWLGNATANTGVKGALNPGMSLPVTGGGSGGGCPSERVEVKVIVAPDVPVDLGPDGIECSGFVIDAFDPTFVSYTWSTGASQSSITADSTGAYYVDVVNAFGCTGSDTINLTINPSPTVDLGPSDTTTCGAITLDAGNPGATYVWSEPGQFGQTLQVTQSGQYFVNVNLLGCEGTDSIDVVVNPAPAVDLGQDLSTCIDITLDAGNAGANFLWSTGATSQTITVSPPATGSDTITVVVTNASLCDASDEIIISAGTPPTVDLGPDAQACDSVVLDAGNPGATFTWSTGAVTQTITAAASGTYSVEVIDGSGCQSSDTVDITVDTKPTADFIWTNSGYTYDFMDMSTGGNSYSWDFGDGAGTSTDPNPSYTYQFDGTYEVTLIVTNDCGSDTTVLRVDGVDIDDEAFGRIIRLYPNPTKGEFFVAADDFTAPELTIEVTDSRGRIVFEEKKDDVYGGFNIRVDLRGEAEGVYLVKISDGERTAYKRVVRE